MGCFWGSGARGLPVTAPRQESLGRSHVDSLYVTQKFVSRDRRFVDDLPVVSAARLRSLDLIGVETTEFVVHVGNVEQLVEVKLRKFPNGGSWSLFVCPTCGLSAKVLRALNGGLVCWRCCFRCGVRYRSEPAGRLARAERRISKLRAGLESTESLRLKPHLWGTMERRSRLEAALRKAEFIVAQRGAPRKKVEAIIDPCDEPDFVAPKRPWPRWKSKLSELD